MRRRTVLGGAGVTLSLTLAGCGDRLESISDESPEQGNESTGDDDEPDSEPIDTDDDQIYEDKSVEGEVTTSEAASEYLSALRHTYTWDDDPPGDSCNVHVQLENVGDEEVTVDMEARIYDENGVELSSTRYADEPGPTPGDIAVYSFPLSNCENTAAYELEIGGFGNEDESDASNGSDTSIIDDFEDYNSRGLPRSWTLDGGGTADVSSSAALHEDSSQGLRQDGDSNVRSFPGQGLSNYPEDGREVSVLMRPDSSGSQPWILVGMEDDVWSTETPGWRLIIDPDGGIRIAREMDSGAEVLDKNSRLPNLVGEIVDCRFIADSSDGVTFWIQDLDGTMLGSVSTSVTDGIEDEMSIGFRSTQGVDWDWLRLV